MLCYHPSDPRSSLEGYEGNLTPSEEAALAELEAAVEGLDLRSVRGEYGQGLDSGDHAVEPLRLCLLRFLRGNSFDVSKALDQLQQCVDYREQHPTDKLLAKSPKEVLGCDVEEYNSFYPRWLMGYDRLDRPILVTRYGSLRLWDMSKLTSLERMTELHIREQELLLRLLRRRTAEGGVGGAGNGVGKEEEKQGEGSADNLACIVDTAVVIIDTAGLTLRHVTKDFVRLFKMRAQLDQLLFPEMLGKCFIVNTPSLFGYVWAMFSPFVHPRTRAKISIITRPQDWKVALREIADADQISPEYGGTGSRQADLPPLADALYAAGNRRSLSVGRDAEDTSSQASRPLPPSVTLPPGASTVTEREKIRSRVSVSPGDEEETKVKENIESSDRRESWFEGVLGTTAFSRWGGVSETKREREASAVTNDEEFFDALAELDRSEDGVNESAPTVEAHNQRPPSRTGSSGGNDDAKILPYHDTELGCEALPISGDQPDVVWRKSWQGASVNFDDVGTPSIGERGSVSTRHGDEAVYGNGAARAWRAAVGFCCATVLGWLQQRSVKQLARWLGFANVVSALLAMTLIVAGAGSLSTSWLGALLGWQWGAIVAVCLGSLLLLLALLGTVGTRLLNRFSLLAFAALEGAVACGMLLSGVWCLALAGGSATISGLTWEAIKEERNMSETKEEFLSGARHRLVFLGASSLVLSLFSLVGPCVLALALSGKIRRLEDAEPRRDEDKRFEQLRRSFHETNALCTMFACVSTGYAGYGLSFTIALGLAANVTSTYLMVAGGYALLLTGVVGAWAAVSARPDAFRIHFGVLLPAGALYASLCVVQLVHAGSSNEHVENAWTDLNAGGYSLYSVQAKVRTMLIVGGVLSAVTTMLVSAAAVASWAARKALLMSPSRGSHQNRAKLTLGEKLVACWALALAATSTFFDGSFAVFSAWLARDGDQAVWLTAFWRAMGRGDRRYVEGDTFVVASAVILAAVIGPGALLYAWSVYCRKGYRFSVGVLVCTASVQTQVLRYVTQGGSGDSTSSPGSKAVFVVASLVLALLKVVGALVVLVYNIRRMTTRVHAAEVQYRALLLKHDHLALEEVDANTGDEGGRYRDSGRRLTGTNSREISATNDYAHRRSR